MGGVALLGVLEVVVGNTGGTLVGIRAMRVLLGSSGQYWEALGSVLGGTGLYWGLYWGHWKLVPGGTGGIQSPY